MTGKPAAKHCVLLILVILGFGDVRLAKAQDNYEIQVYGSDTVAPKSTMLELHSNFTVEGSSPGPGSQFTAEGVYPTNHAEHETVEITQGVNSWSEVGFYIFTSARSGDGWQWVGDHIRPRVRAPDSWHWPVGVSLSVEFGYQRASFSQDTWTLELRPIIDKQIGRWYFTVNPALERSFHGPSVPQGVGLPSAKFSYDFTKYISAAWILRCLRIDHRSVFVSQSAAAVFSDNRSECVPELGDQLWGGDWGHGQYRSSDCEGYPGATVRLDASSSGQF